MKFSLKACSRLKKELGIDFENLGEALQDPEKALKIAEIGLEAAGEKREGAGDLTVGEILHAITRDMGGDLKKPETQE